MATNAPHFKSRQMTEWNECKIYVIGRSTHQLQYAYWQQKVSCRTRSHDIFCSTKNVLSQTINTTIFGRRLFRWRFDFRVRRKMKTENLFIYFFSLIVQTFHCVVLFVYSSFVRVLFFFLLLVVQSVSQTHLDSQTCGMRWTWIHQFRFSFFPFHFFFILFFYAPKHPTVFFIHPPVDSLRVLFLFDILCVQRLVSFYNEKISLFSLSTFDYLCFFFLFLFAVQSTPANVRDSKGKKKTE